MSRIAGLVVLAALMALVAAFPAGAQVPVPEPPKTPTAEGWGGSAATVDPLATQTAIDVLRSGGNAVDAAVAAAGVLGVIEPFSCGIGGGGFMVIYDAKRRKVDTIDSREAAPAGLAPNRASSRYKASSQFQGARVSGLSVGVPGTVRGWETALKRYGTRSLRSLLRPGERIAREGFVVDQTFVGPGRGQRRRLRRLHLDARDLPDRKAPRRTVGVDPPQPGPGRRPTSASARTRTASTAAAIARDIAQTVQHPPEAADSDRPHEVHPGSMTTRDLARYDAIRRKPTKVDYRGLDVYGMGPPSSGGSTVGEALNILEGFSPLGADREQALHRYLEASKLAYADRNEFVGDPDFVDVPLRGLLSDGFARRAARADHATTRAPRAAGPGRPVPSTTTVTATAAGRRARDDKGQLDDAPDGRRPLGQRRLLHVHDRADRRQRHRRAGPRLPAQQRADRLQLHVRPGQAPNSPDGGKRPRSSMAPTIVFDHGRPAVALGSPGGATIITTVLQMLVNHVDFGLEPARRGRGAAGVAAQQRRRRRPSRRSSTHGRRPRADERARPHVHALTPNPPGEIGAVEAIRFLPRRPPAGGGGADPPRRRLGDGVRPLGSPRRPSGCARRLRATTPDGRRMLDVEDRLAELEELGSIAGCGW